MSRLALKAPTTFVSIHDIGDIKNQPAGFTSRINSPRTLHACEMLGLSISEIEPVNLANVRAYYETRDKTKKVP